MVVFVWGELGLLMVSVILLLPPLSYLEVGGFLSVVKVLDEVNGCIDLLFCFLLLGQSLLLAGNGLQSNQFGLQFL